MNILIASDLHLSRKPWPVRKALKKGQDADLVLLTGDLTNDGTAPQFSLLAQCIADILADTPVFSTAGNHDFPARPLPETQCGICNYAVFQEWLLRRQPHPYYLDESGAYALSFGHIEIIGLNCVGHWRRFQFRGQLDWLEHHLRHSRSRWHILLCHAPLRLHSPAGKAAPYLNRDKELQKILDQQGHCIFLSGHTHISMESPAPCVEFDRVRQNLYINSGSIRPTTLLDAQGKPIGTSAPGNVVKLELTEQGFSLQTIGLPDGSVLQTRQPGFFPSVP